MKEQVRSFTVNYNGEKIKTGEVMVPFPYAEEDAELNCVNKACIKTLYQGGKKFKVIYKAVPAEWERTARSALNLEQNEKLGHYSRHTVSRDELVDEYELELGEARSAEEEALEEMERNETKELFREIMGALIRKSPKIGYGVLLLYSGIRGEEFYDRMMLSRDSANKILQQAKRILLEGLANLDVDGIRCYKSRNEETYTREAFKLLEETLKDL